ncbi:hypothetical protein IJT17_06030 [bacterium]|nr:hypothetical protein [bacterium]
MKLFGRFGKTCGKIVLALAVAGCLAGGADEAWSKDAGLGNHGHINHTQYHKGEKASCSIAELPTTLEGFKALQEQIATEPQGAVVCFLAAMNVYVNDEAEGTECLKLASYKIGGSEISTLRQKLRGSDDDSYAQKYLPYAHFKGANAKNGYTPDNPLTLEVSVNNGLPYRELSDEEAPVIYLNFKTQGTDLGQRSVSVIKPYDSDYFVVFERAGLYMQVKNPPRSKRNIQR